MTTTTTATLNNRLLPGLSPGHVFFMAPATIQPIAGMATDETDLIRADRDLYVRVVERMRTDGITTTVEDLLNSADHIGA